MPGPGGGSRGGGFGGGGGRAGGGFGGGHRPGGFHRPHYHHHYHRPFFFPRPYFGFGYGGGCLGGLMGMMLLPIILIFIVISLLFSVFGSIGNSISNVASGGHFVQDDRQMEEYALAQYNVEFDDAVGYEDNILIVFLVDESREGFYTMALVGYNINDEINDMFGNQYTEYGRELTDNLNPHYENTLSQNLRATVNAMTCHVANLKLKSSFYEDEGSPAGYISHVTNHSTLPVSEETINDSLEYFTQETDIPIVVVIDDMDAVFDKRIDTYDIITVIFAVVLLGVAIYFIVRAFKGKGDGRRDEESDGRRGEEGRDPRDDDTHW